MGVKYNLAVKVGGYTDRDGNHKNKWQNVGVMLEGKYGPYILLNRFFNPAGVPCDPDDESIPISLFEPKNKPQTGGKQSDYDEDVPF